MTPFQKAVDLLVRHYSAMKVGIEDPEELADLERQTAAFLGNVRGMDPSVCPNRCDGVVFMSSAPGRGLMFNCGTCGERWGLLP